MGWWKKAKKYTGLSLADKAMHSLFGGAWESVENATQDVWDAVKPIVGVIAGIAGLVAAPFTGGASLYVTAASWGAIAGSGITTGVGLLQGADWEDLGDASVRAGLLGGVTGAAGAWGTSIASAARLAGASNLVSIGKGVGAAAGAGAVGSATVGSLTGDNSGEILKTGLIGGGSGAVAGGVGSWNAVSKINAAAEQSLSSATPDGLGGMGGGGKNYDMSFSMKDGLTDPSLPKNLSVAEKNFLTATSAENLANYGTPTAKSLGMSLATTMLTQMPTARSVAFLAEHQQQAELEKLPELDMMTAPASTKEQVVLEGEQPGTGWDRTFGSLYGGTDLLQSSIPERLAGGGATRKKTPEGVSDDLLLRTGSLMA